MNVFRDPMRAWCQPLLIALLVWAAVGEIPERKLPAVEPSREEAAEALRKAVSFFHDHCSKHGGYVWRYSRDLSLSEGEGETDASQIWVQPPDASF